MIGRILCRFGIHRADYAGNPWTQAPRPIRCERCGKEL